MSTVSFPFEQPALTRARRRRLARFARRHWYVWLALAATALQLLTLWRVLHPVGPGTYPPLKDSVIFEYLGWQLADGARLYVDLWEVKPPLPFEVTAAFALLADGNVHLYHALLVAVSATAAVGGALVVGLLTVELTSDEAAGVAAGLALYALPAYHWRVAFGFKPKYFVVLLGLLGVYLALRDRPFLAGAAAAASAGFWQLAVVFPALALGLGYQRAGRRGAGWTAAGGLAVAVAVLAPVVWWGAVEAMVAEVVLTPLLVTNDAGTVADQIGYAATLFGRTLPVVFLGAVGLLVGVIRAPRERWWLLVGAGWFAVQLLTLDLDLYPDLIPTFAFVALGIGLALGARDRTPTVLYGLVAAMVIVSVATLGPLAVAEPVEPPAASAIEAPYLGDERPGLLWRTVESETCRPFFGETQRKVVGITGGSYADETCGALEPLWEAFSDRWFGSGAAADGSAAMERPVDAGPRPNR